MMMVNPPRIPFVAALLVLLLLSVALVIVECSPLRLDDRAMLERGKVPLPSGWRRVICQPTSDVTLMVLLRQRNLERLRSFVHEVSDPTSSRYAEYMSASQLRELIGPSASDVAIITEWLDHEMIATDQRHWSIVEDSLRLTLSASQASRLLRSKFECFSNQRSEIVRTLVPFSVPRAVAHIVHLVPGIRSFPRVAQRDVQPTKMADTIATAVGITPAMIGTFFNNTGAVGTYKNNSQAVAEFLGQYFSESDLAIYLTSNKLPNNTVAVIQGPNNPQRPGVEATLDIQVIMGVAVGVPTWFVSQRGGSHVDPFLEYFHNMLNTPNAPWVHSISYSDVESDLTDEYKQRCTTEFQKFGSLGHSVLFSSGDNGAGCTGCSTFAPNWPASDPYITSVGGIVLSNLASWSAYGDTISAGGFSNTFARPSYQNTVVTKYLNTASLPTAIFNSSGRGFPDIAAFSEAVEIVFNGAFSTVGGTSAACPMVAALIALINDARLTNNLPPMGFLNPWLYTTGATYSDAFLDIITGSNGGGCCPQAKGFPCQVGWDPVTGLGAPNYSALLKYALAAGSKFQQH